VISVLFPYRGDDGPRDRLFGYVLNWWQAFFPEAEICVGRNFDQPFNRGAARNDAFNQSTGSVLIIADADTIPTVHGVKAGIADVVAEKVWCIPYAEERYYNLNEEMTEVLLKNTVHFDRMEPTEAEYDHKITSWAGCLILPREAWETVGGYDERFKGWGGEDNAFQLSLDVLWGPHRRQDSYCCHLWHPVLKENSFENPHWPFNRSLMRQYQQAKNEEAMRAVRQG
jgi:hypothetical protein